MSVQEDIGRGEEDILREQSLIRWKDFRLKPLNSKLLTHKRRHHYIL